MSRSKPTYCLQAIVLVSGLTVVSAKPGFIDPHHHHHHVEYAPIIHKEYVKYHEPVIAKVGAYVEHIPPAISHQSSTIVHSKGHHIVHPILKPVLKTYLKPIVKTVHVPIIKHYDHHFHDLHHDFHGLHHDFHGLHNDFHHDFHHHDPFHYHHHF